MSIDHLLIADLILFGMACSAYLQYKSFKTIAKLPARSQRRTPGLDRTGVLTAVEGVAYAALGVIFETICISKAFFG